MSYIYQNITGNIAVNLAGKNNASYPFSKERIKSISLCNTHGTDSVGIDLYYYKETVVSSVLNNYDAPVTTPITYYFLKNVKIPIGTTLKLNEEDIAMFNSKEYALYIKLSASDSTVDVIITIN